MNILVVVGCGVLIGVVAGVVACLVHVELADGNLAEWN
jgi:hypothetical protein